MLQAYLRKGCIALVVLALLTCAVLLLSSGKESQAQYERPDIDEDLMKMMHPVELARKYVTDDELPQQIAEFKWKLFNEYQKKGFSKDEAFQLVVTGSVPFSASQ